MMPITIAPKLFTKISDDDHKKLLAFFAEQDSSQMKVWKQGVVSLKDGTVVNIPYDIVQRQRKKGRKGLRYELVSYNQLGQGCMGAVYQVEGTIAIDEGQIRFKGRNEKKHPRAIKIQNHTDEHPVEKARTEYDLSTKASHLAIKSPTIIANTSYTVMAEIKGATLLSIIADDLSKRSILTLDQRKNLTKALLSALKEQVTDKGIIHRDIKSENIMVELTPSIQVKIIDYGLSVEVAKPDNQYPGSYFYGAPELFNELPQTPKVDVFSMARVIALIWYVDLKSYIEPSKYDYSNVKLDNLFNGIDGLDDEQKCVIKTTLEGMLKANAAERISIEQAIDWFSHLDRLAASSKSLFSAVTNSEVILNIKYDQKLNDEEISWSSDSSMQLDSSRKIVPSTVTEKVTLTNAAERISVVQPCSLFSNVPSAPPKAKVPADADRMDARAEVRLV